MTEGIIIAILAACALGIVASMVKTKRPVRALLASCAQGLLAMAAVNLSGALTGVFVGVNPLSLSCACLGGVPGVVGMLVMNMIMR